MGELIWTPRQQEAIRTVGRSILVSAGAGSGKTAVLSERCAFLAADARPACPIDRLLVVTFTDAAATEMRQRIAQALRRRLAAAPTNSWLQQQLALLDTAWISTIHSFCRRVLNRYFAQADVDPLAPVMEANDAELLRQEAARRVFDELGEREDAAGEAFLELSAHYGGASDDRLIARVLEVDSFLASVPAPEAWISACLKSYESSGADRLPAAWGDLLVQTLTTELEQQRGSVTAHIEAMHNGSKAAAPVIACLEPAREAMEQWLSELKGGGGAALDKVCAGSIAKYEFPSAPRRTKKLKESLSADEQAAFDAAIDVLKEVQSSFDGRIRDAFGKFSVADWVDGIARTRGHVAAFLSLAKEVRAAYRAAKRDLGVLDFADLERFTLDLLRDGRHGVAEQLRERFQHVLVDEFQDVNPVQAEILRLVSRESRGPAAGNLFAVGDVKQCIYRFRLAEPRLFLERGESFRRDASGVVIDLVENFRSRPVVLDAVNAVFERLMTPEMGGVDYDEHARLVAGLKSDAADQASCSGPPIELHVLDDSAVESAAEESEENADQTGVFDLERVEREAFVAAERIKNLVAEGANYRDIVVLLRTFQAHAGLFVRRLARLGIPVFAEISGNFLDALEVLDVLSLLMLLDNQQQDIPLAAVLRSPLLGEALTDSQLAAIAASGRGFRGAMSFHAAVGEYLRSGADAALRGRLAAVLERLEQWRRRICRRPLADVLWEIYEESGYFAYVAGLRDGRQRQANLLQLHEYARQFDSFSRQGLHRFLKFIEALRKSGQDLEAGAVAAPSADVVRIMTIHRGKGLEFPIVILADLGKRFNLRDVQDSILFDRRLGVGLKAADLERRITYPTLPHRLVAQATMTELLAEELRILYVAMTRAQKRLILIGTKGLAGLEKVRLRHAGRRGPLPLLDRQTARSLLDWLAAAICCQHDDTVGFAEDGAPLGGKGCLFTVCTHSAQQMTDWVIEPPQHTGVVERLRAIAAGQALPSVPPAGRDQPAAAADRGPAEAVADSAAAEIVARVARRLTTPYPAAELSKVPAVAAASVLKRRWDTRQDQEQPVASWPARPAAVLEEILAPAVAARALARPESGAARALARPESGAARALARPPIRRRLNEPAFATAAAADPVARGTWTHELLQRTDLRRSCDLADLQEQMRGMVAAGTLVREQAEAIDLDGVAWFFSSDLGRRVRSAGRVLREWPFVLGVDPRKYDPHAEPLSPEDLLLVRGIIDCLFDAGEGWEILDYKTDAVSGDELAARAAEYRGQLDIYAAAVEAAWSVRPTRRWLAFLTARQIVAV